MTNIINVALVLFLALLMGCSSHTALQCGADGSSSYVTLVNHPGDIASVKSLGELCAFNSKEP